MQELDSQTKFRLNCWAGPGLFGEAILSPSIFDSRALFLMDHVTTKLVTAVLQGYR